MSDVKRTPSGTFQAATSIPEAEIEQRVGQEFRELFGKGRTPIEIQRQLERLEMLKSGAEKKLDVILRQKGESNPLAIALFMDRYRRCGVVETAVIETRNDLEKIREMGGLEPPKETT